MPFWEQLLIYQGLAGLHAVIAKYAAKCYTPEEIATLQAAADLMGQLGYRLDQGGSAPKVIGGTNTRPTADFATT